MKINWQQEQEGAIARLQRMLRFDTVNPPGSELQLAQALAAEASTEGIESEVLVSGEGRGNLVLRLRGDGSERPLLLLSHLDVVPVEPDKWTYPPFAGTRAQGFVWGRGAIDSKLTGALHMQVLLMARRLGLSLKRDIVLVAAADEEYGGHYGVEWLVREHPELFDAEYALNEAGGFAVQVAGKSLYTVQVGEKGAANLDLVASGQPGHSSVPHDDNAVFHLAKVLTRMAGKKMPHRPPASVRAFFARAAQAQDDAQVAGDLLALLDAETCDDALTRLPVNEATRRMFDAMVRNTCAPTIVEAGLKRNVIPSQARAQLSGRPLPAVGESEFVAEVEALAGAGVEYAMGDFRSGVEFDHDTPLFAALENALRRFEPESVAVPYMQTGGTDARFLIDSGMIVYGFVPMRYEEGLDFFDLCHGHDERVSEANVAFGLQVLFDAIARLNGIDIEGV
ncbi:MAG: acetylornithine deacetylase/succinyl-diaminopimelate desuccinylase-like protein [Planctomycetota bacterium]|jgi:acetylornithine deacetylase/succinyl-diaminopimelate desuccinylase-like protein